MFRMGKKKFYDEIRQTYEAINRHQQSVKDRFKNTDRRIESHAEAFQAVEKELRRLENQTTGRPNRTKNERWYRFFGPFSHEESYTKYSLQEQLDQIRDHLGLEYTAEIEGKDSQSKLVASKKPVKKTTRKKTAAKKAKK